MEVYKQLISIIDTNLIYYLTPMILTLMQINVGFKNRFATHKALYIIRWIIIVYTIIMVLHLIIGSIFYPTDSSFINRATGPYKVTFWILFLFSTLLPFKLLLKKLVAFFWYVLLVEFLIKTGAYFERFVIITTSLHRDYLPPNNTPSSFNFPFIELSLIVLQGVLMGILLLGIFTFRNRKSSLDTSRRLMAIRIM